MTTDIVYAPYIEVETAFSARRANDFLKAGYVLLNIQQGTAAHYPKGIKDGQFMVRKYPVFVLGRTADVAVYEPAENGVSEAVPA